MGKRLMILAAAVLLALVLTVPAAASKPLVVEGKRTWLEFIVPPVEEQRGNRCFVTATIRWGWTGDISGEAVTKWRAVAQGPCMGPGVWEEITHREDWFTGTVRDSDPGTIRMTCPGKFYLDPQRWEERCVLHSGTGGLANLHGTIQGYTPATFPYVGDYRGEVRFDPK